MNSKLEKLENNQVKLTFTVSPEKLEEGMQHSYNKNKGNISLPGFRKGKIPRALIEKQYGKEIFLDDAINYVFPDAYEEALNEHDIDPVSRPQLENADVDDENGLTLEATVTVKPEVALGEYKGLTYEDYEVAVEDSEIDAEIEQAREKNARIITVTVSAVQDGDTAVIDFEGFIDDVAFEGGKGEDHQLVIGSKTFIDTFEEQLIGKNSGDDVDVNVTFPEDYGQPALAGKPALFKVTVKEITAKELPAMDDEFAQDVSEFDTFDEYKNSIKEKLIHQKEHKKEHDIEDSLIKKACDNATIDIPDVMVENQVNQMVQEFSSRVSQQGLDMESFLRYSGQTIDAFKEGYRESAQNNVKARLVLEAIAAKEEIKPTDEDIETELKRISTAYGIEEDKIRDLLRPEDIKGLEIDLKTQKALKVITDSAVAEKK